MKKGIKFAAVLFLLAGCLVSSAFKNPQIEVTNDKGVYVVKVPQESIKNIRPHIVRFLQYNKTVFEETGAELVINAGYFDPKNKNTSSYVIIDGETVLDPKTNSSLMNNAALKPHLLQILDRTEFRVLDCNGKRKYDIRKHSLPPFGLKKDQLQGCPCTTGGAGIVSEFAVGGRIFC